MPEETTEQKLTTWWDRFERFSKVSAQITVIGGIIIALSGAHVAERNSRLQSLAPIQQYIDEDFKIQGQISTFKFDELPNLEKKAANQPGSNFYFLNELGVATIGEHYERMGAELKLHYLDFELVYEVIPFPDEFWENTRNLRTKLRAHWRRDGSSLPDLWSNFGYLCELYRSRRTPDPIHPLYTDVKGCRT